MLRESQIEWRSRHSSELPQTNIMVGVNLECHGTVTDASVRGSRDAEELISNTKATMLRKIIRELYGDIDDELLAITREVVRIPVGPLEMISSQQTIVDRINALRRRMQKPAPATSSTGD